MRGMAAVRLRPRLRGPKLSTGLFRSSVTIGVAIAAASAITAATQLGLARLLQPAEYSLVATLFVVIAIVGVPLGALQATIARDVAADFVERAEVGAGEVVIGSARELGRVSAPVALAVVLVAIPVTILLHVPHVTAMAETAVAVAGSMALTVVWAGLQGTQRFTAFGLGQVGFALLKLLLAVGAAWVGLGVAGVMGAIAAATIVMLVAGVGLMPFVRAAAHLPRERRALFTRYSQGATVCLTIFAVLTTADVLVARVALGPSRAGAYAAASVVARAVLLIPTAITTVLFPHVATMRDRPRERRHLLAALGATVAASAVPVAIFLAAGRPLVRAVFGSRYSAAGHWVGWLSLAMALYAIAFVYLFHALSTGRTRFWIAGSVVLAGQTAGFALFHASGRELVVVQLVAALALATAGELYDRRAT